MAELDEKFKEFLKANSSKQVEGDLSSEQITSLYAEYGDKFSRWLKVPETVRNYYGGRVPDYIMEAIEEGDERTKMAIASHPEMTQEQVKDLREEQEKRENDALTKVLTAAVAAGYTAEAADALAQEASFRASLAEKALNGTMTEEEKKLWAESRRHTRDIIKRDWAENQPEKYLIHVLAKLNAGKLSEEEAMPQLADLMMRIQNGGRADMLDEYLSRPNIQAKVKRFDTDRMMDIVSDITGRVNGHLPQGREKSQPQQTQTETKDFPNLQRDLPEDILRVLEKIKMLQNNMARNIENPTGKREMYNHMSSMRRHQNQRSLT
ncbi:MAG: hypothetical protein IJ852_01350 [Alphaproteobacteria bacterium]|nr:hypothetical protein [Alphaproteobacteria bacterium]